MFREGVDAMRSAKVFEAKNARAVSLVKSWLRSLGIGFAVSSAAGSDLVVTARDGRKVPVQVDAGASPALPEGAVRLEAGVLTGRKVQEALDLFSGFVTSLGYEAKAPVNRGELPEKKLSYEEHFEEVAMRHSELRRCPNPTTADLTKYEVVLKKATWNFLRMNQRLCADNMLDFADLFSYAQVWTINYLGYYEVPAHQDVANNNEKKLYYFLWQRFSEFRGLLGKKGRNVFATLDVASLGQKGEPYDYNEKSAWLTGPDREEEDEEETVDEEYVARRCELDVRTPNTRRASATRLLDQLLGSLGHDDFVLTLQEASMNDRIHPDAQKEAARRLADHALTCASCSLLHEGSLAIEENEDAAGVHAAGAEE